MTTYLRKYFVRVPAEFSHNDNFYWQELHDVKTLTQAQQYVNHVFGGLAEAEIWVSKNGGMIRLVTKKNAEGKWGLMYSNKIDSDPHGSSNHHYHLRGMRVSKEDFYKYGFQHEKQK